MCLVNSKYIATKVPKPFNIPGPCDGVLFKLESLSAVFFAVYRPPGCTSAESEQLIAALENILCLTKDETILGDINFPDINWQTDPPLAKSHMSESLIELTAAWDMTQIVPEPTRGSNYLDIILTTLPFVYSNCRIMPPVFSSDHNLVICNVTVPRCTRQSREVISRID